MMRADLCASSAAGPGSASGPATNRRVITSAKAKRNTPANATSRLVTPATVGEQKATWAAAHGLGLLADIETLHLDRGYGGSPVRDCAAAYGITDLICGKRRDAGTNTGPRGIRWPIERTNSSNFGQLRRNTDRRIHHRLAQLALAITAKLIDYRNRWMPDLARTR